MTDRVPADIWEDIVEHSPLVSVDLVVEHDDGVVLGRRENEPARGEWFIPGGVVKKSESLTKAVDRVAHEEIGCGVSIRTQLGVYEHFYDSSEFEDMSKHYVPVAYVVEPEGQSFEPDSQHSALKVFSPPFTGFHEYVQAYLDDYVTWKS